MKIVLNKCYGGFGLSDRAYERLIELGATDITSNDDSRWLSLGRYFKSWGYTERGDPLLVQVVEELGYKAYGAFAKLFVVDVPDGIEWEIDDYDGIETIHEVHRSW